MYLLNEYRIKMRPHRLTPDINKRGLNLYFKFQFFICEVDNCSCLSLIIRIKKTVIYKNVVRYWIENQLRYVIKYKNNATSLQMA